MRLLHIMKAETNVRTTAIDSVALAVIVASLIAVTPTLRGLEQSTPDATLAISGDVSSPLTVSAREIKTMPRTTVTVSEEGRDVKYEGVLVGELLKRAGAPTGRDMTGAAVATYVVASAKDGYRAVFSLAELDPGFTSNDVIVADTVDGKPLFDYQGPLRIVAPHDKRGARSVRMLQKIEVVRLPK
ncbi:MAG TPA: molybdopterin-dependent oxidoreductase [Vicinamibacterales bacterium]|nr:molybdopterin-dependent oxidoreductase [Vicinamibacterales bacterium]